ncbi:hypothetical protein OH76DRAFT_531647 [Lentinus brumalis]|uniref:Uncharacterized protein n=1 Tax=Lentinus brumalis TaxID=2498619 RepID=A0A371DAA2_9APHY|nr:hypothetical protein OH76DRAFT_531647 [Polyporus brumalis]
MSKVGRYSWSLCCVSTLCSPQMPQKSESVGSPRLISEVAEDDFADINVLGPQQVQARCLSRIEQYRGRIAALRAIYNLGALRMEEDALPYLHEAGLQATGLPGLPEFALEKMKECKTRMRGLRSLYNFAAPINHILPVELLSEVFSYLRPDFNRRWGMSILHVCRFWTDVMHKTPRFWANLLATHQEVTTLPGWKLSRYRLALNLSATLHLSLSLIGLPVVLAELLRPHAHRISLLHVSVAQSIDGLNLLFEADMPVLQSLAVTPWINNWRFRERQKRLSANYIQLPTTLPALRNISVAAEHFSMASSLLRRVELTSCWCVGCQAYDRRIDPILLALSQCTSLEELSLTNCLPEHEPYPDSPQVRCSPGLSATLPHLRRLAIESQRRSVAIILPRLIVPPTTTLEFNTPGRFKLPSPVDMQSFQAITTADHVFLSLRDTPREPNVMEVYDVHGRQTLSVIANYQEDYWEQDEDGRDPYAPPGVCYAQDVADIFASANSVTSLRVVGRLNAHVRPPYNPWATVVDTFPSLHRLDIGHPADNLSSILEILSQPRLDGRCRCPSLRELCLLWPSEAMWPWIVDPGREPADESSSSSESDAYGEDESVSDESESRPASSGVLVDTFFAARRDWSWYLQGTCDNSRLA